jgi:hypothetical protein
MARALNSWPRNAETCLVTGVPLAGLRVMRGFSAALLALQREKAAPCVSGAEFW